jgi:hypothetical protein
LVDNFVNSQSLTSAPHYGEENEQEEDEKSGYCVPLVFVSAQKEDDEDQEPNKSNSEILRVTAIVAIFISLTAVIFVVTQPGHSAPAGESPKDNKGDDGNCKARVFTATPPGRGGCFAFVGRAISSSGVGNCGVRFVCQRSCFRGHCLY